MEIRKMSTTQSTTGRQYENVTEDEFDAFMNDLATYEKHVPADSREVAYDIPLPTDDLVIRVWSTIVRGNSRDCGDDSIKAVVWDTENGKPVGGREKTLRLAPTDSNPEGWKGNLRPKIQDLVANWRKYDKVCPKCGNRMALREPGRNDNWTAFWGCTNYPVCEHSE